MATAAPSAASRSAIPAPMPRLAPVTMARRPANRLPLTARLRPGQSRAPSGTRPAVTHRYSMSSSSSPWFTGRMRPCSITRSAFGRPAAGTRCGTWANAGWRVTLPVHTMRVSMPWPSMCSWNSARRMPDSGRMQHREHVPTGLEPLQLARQHEHVGIGAEERRQDVEVALPAGEVDRQLAQLHIAERGADLARLEVPAHLVEDEQVVVLDAVDLGEEALVTLLGCRRTGARNDGPTGAAAGTDRSARRRRGAPCRRCRRR